MKKAKLIKYAIGAAAVIGVYEVFLKNRAAPPAPSAGGSSGGDMGAPSRTFRKHRTRGAMRPGRSGGGGGGRGGGGSGPTNIYYGGDDGSGSGSGASGDPFADFLTLAKDLETAKGGY